MSFTPTSSANGIDPDHHGGVAIVFIVCAGCFSFLTVTIRFGIISTRKLGIGLDDISFVLSWLFALLQSVVIGRAVYCGLGRHVDTLSPNQVTSLLKSTYSNRILAVCSLGFAKLSVAFLYRRLEFYVHGRLHMIPVATAVCWTVFSLFAVAFQCETPSPWLVSPSHCPAGTGLTVSVAVLNFLSDAILVAFPLPGLWILSTAGWPRLTVIYLFSSRFIVCVMAVIDVIYAVRIFDSRDQSWDQLTPVITLTVLVNLSLIVATAARLHSFFAKIPSGRATSRLPTFAIGDRWRWTISTKSTKAVRSTPGVEWPESSSEQKLVSPVIQSS